MTKQEIPQHVIDLPLLSLMLGLRSKASENSLEGKIFDALKKTKKRKHPDRPNDKKIAKSGKNSGKINLFQEIPLDYEDKKSIVEAMQKFEKGKLSFIPDENTFDKIIDSYQDALNRKVELFQNESLPEIYRLLNIKQADYQATPIKYMSEKSEFLKNNISSFVNNQYDRKYILNLIKNNEKREREYDLKGANLVFYSAVNSPSGAPFFFAHKVKDVLRLASKLREIFLDIYDKDDKKTNQVSYKTAKKRAELKAKKSEREVTIDDIINELNIPLDGPELTDYRGIEVVVPEGQEEKYKNKLLSTGRFVLLEEKSEKELDYSERKSLGKPIFAKNEKKFEDRFKHLRLKVYDVKTKGIMDIHITNFLSKNIKDYKPGIAHNQRGVGIEAKLAKRHALSEDLKNKFYSFFKSIFRLRALPPEFDFFMRTHEDRFAFISDYLNAYNRGNLTQEQISLIDEIADSTGKISKKLIGNLRSKGFDDAKISSLKQKSNLSVLIDLAVFQIDNALKETPLNELFYETDRKYNLLDSGGPGFTQILADANYMVKLHTAIYGGTDEKNESLEGKDWKHQKYAINEITRYISNIEKARTGINEIISYALGSEVQDISESYKKLGETINIYNVISGQKPAKRSLKKFHNRMLLDIMGQIVCAYADIHEKRESKTQLENQEIIDNIQSSYQRFINDFSMMQRRGRLTQEELSDFDEKLNIFEDIYKKQLAKINDL